MEFRWPLMLLALGLVPLLGVGYRFLLRRQRRIAERFAESRLFEHLVVRPPAWQRTLPPACYLVAVALLAVALARPVGALPLPVNQAAVIVAVDASKSMVATDIAPTRVESAKTAARTLASLVPRSTKIGLVSFSDYGTLLLAPTTDRTAFAEALERVQLQSATSVGGGILESVRVLPGREAAFRERLDRLMRRATGRTLPPNPLEPRPNPEDLVPASVIIFSDGVTNFGPDPYEAAQLARDAKVRVFTVGLGTPGGTVMRIDGQLVLVPFDPAGLERIAQITGAQYFSSTSDEDLRQISGQLGRILGWEWSRVEVSFLLLAIAGLFVLGGGAMSMTWFRRLP